jgi:hypothetical protein
MLAPGELLTKPADEPPASPPPQRPADPHPAPAVTGEPDDHEPDSFLMILLRALGAIHT